MSSESFADSVFTQRHAVQFYGHDASLFKTVSGFLCEGLIAGEPAVVIATAEHGAAIIEHLAARLIDVERARNRGDLIVLDGA
jgi:hypothetical protein